MKLYAAIIDPDGDPIMVLAVAETRAAARYRIWREGFDDCSLGESRINLRLAGEVDGSPRVIVTKDEESELWERAADKTGWRQMDDEGDA